MSIGVYEIKESIKKHEKTTRNKPTTDVITFFERLISSCIFQNLITNGASDGA